MAATAGVSNNGRSNPGLIRTPNIPEPESAAPHPEIADHQAGTEEEVLLEGDERFMSLSAEERQIWEAMMAEREGNLKSGKEKFKKWLDGITRRRMFAYSRARKLHESFKQRSGFYGDLTAYLAMMENKVKDGQNQKEKEEEEARATEGQADKVTKGQTDKVTEGQADKESQGQRVKVNASDTDTKANNVSGDTQQEQKGSHSADSGETVIVRPVHM
jgi:hypothetical protein